MFNLQFIREVRGEEYSFHSVPIYLGLYTKLSETSERQVWQEDVTMEKKEVA